ncbi:MAG: patatin family protein [Alphaproteobacteria bacterium]|nr:patatin family protein [Alphaproteobacteria bacterium]
MQKTGLILEGGAKRGIYTAGVLDVFLENGINFDGVIGVSAGAIHGCSFVSKQIGRSIRYNIKYGNDYRFMSFRSLLLSGNIVDTKFCYHDLPEKLDPFDNKTFMESNTNFYVVISNLETGLPEYIHCKDLFKEIDYLRASASMPFVSKIVCLNDKKYLDGGICDSIPLQAAKNLGFTKNIVIATRPIGYIKKPFRLKWLANLIYRKYPKFIQALINRHTMYNNEVKEIENLAKKEEIILIRPSKFINISKMESNLDIVKEMYELGRNDALNMLNQVKQFLA